MLGCYFTCTWWVFSSITKQRHLKGLIMCHVQWNYMLQKTTNVKQSHRQSHHDQTDLFLLISIPDIQVTKSSAISWFDVIHFSLMRSFPCQGSWYCLLPPVSVIMSLEHLYLCLRQTWTTHIWTVTGEWNLPCSRTITHICRENWFLRCRFFPAANFGAHFSSLPMLIFLRNNSLSHSVTPS